MDCFEIQNHMTDAIDGTLASSVRAQTESHLKTCESCTKKMHRMENLIQVMSSQPRASIPTELRTDPLAFKLPAIVRNKNLKTIWRELPLPTRLLIEGLTIAAIVITGIQIGPKIRNFYEEQMDKKLQSMIAAEDLSAEEGTPLARGKMEEDAGGEHEFISEEGEDHHHEINIDPNIQVGKSEVWRFNLKTDSPALVRTKIMKALEDTGIKKETAGFGGIEAPGGIQFDLIVPQEAIPQLKAQLEALATSQNTPTNSEKTDGGLSDTFTWYKNRSKKPIPSGTSRLVIWLSQI